MIKKLNLETFIIFIFGFLINFLLILFYSKASGDGVMFLRVAENIYSNNCISLSLPETAKCVPHWGGNQGPLYPFFISILWKISHNNFIVLLIQQIILSLSLVRFIYVIIKVTHFYPKNLFIIILFISPLSIGWSRFILTECLSISLSILLFSELILCNYKNKIKIYRLIIIFTLGFFLRYDFLLWSIPIIIITYYSIGFYKTILKAIISIFIFATFLSLWSYRNYSQGLSLIPGGEFNSQYITLEENQPSYKGYLKWVETWSWHNYMYAPAVYPLSNNNYKNISISENAFENTEEKEKVNKILNHLKKINGKRYPKFIDDEFLNLAKEKTSSNQLREHLILPIKRSLFMMLNPLTSMGLPSSISNEDKKLFISSDIKNRLLVLSSNFSSVFLKILNFFYRVCVYILFLYLLFNINKFSKNDKILILASLIYFILRIFLFSQVYFTATRHLLQPLIMIEMTIMIIYLKNSLFIKFKK